MYFNKCEFPNKNDKTYEERYENQQKQQKMSRIRVRTRVLLYVQNVL